MAIAVATPSAGWHGDDDESTMAMWTSTTMIRLLFASCSHVYGVVGCCERRNVQGEGHLGRKRRRHGNSSSSSSSRGALGEEEEEEAREQQAAAAAAAQQDLDLD
jgi:hypothetical protein